MSDNPVRKPEMLSKRINRDYVECSSDTSESESDSDEYDILNYSGNTDVFPLTPFNMKEELEEGYFDTEGMYHWKKRTKSDNWLDNLSNHNPQRIQLQHNISSKIVAAEAKETQDYIEIYKKILIYLLPNETIAQALRRLGGKNSLKTIERLKLKKQGTLIDSDSAQQITDLTGLVNIILTKKGDYDIYQKTYNDIHNSIFPPNNSARVDEAISLAVKDKSPVLDMFADDFTEKENICEHLTNQP